MTEDRIERIQRISFPAYVIGISNVAESADVIEAEGQHWVLLYATQELAELYIEQSGGDYVARLVDADDVAKILAAESTLAGVIWNTLLKPEWLCMIPRSEFEG